MVERVGLATGDLVVLEGEGEADLPEKKDKSCGYQIGLTRGMFHSSKQFVLARMLSSAKQLQL